MNRELLMSYALDLARKAEGMTGHYPMVGAVLVKNNRIISGAYFRKPGEPHAEVKAIRAAGGAARGATLVLNLEPCCHFGTNPPCTNAVIKAGIREVVAGMTDPNPLVNGGGFRRLRRAGVRVLNGVLEDECRRLNRHFIKYITTKTPWVTVKLAATADGRIADRNGESRWVTGEASRKFVHQLRSKVQVVMAGIGTVLKDDPRLTARPENKYRQPRPLIVDGMLEVPLAAKVLKTPAKGGAIVACSGSAPRKKRMLLEKISVEIMEAGAGENGMVDLKQLMKKLGERKIASVLCEGGSRLAGALLEQGLADEVMFFYAPKLLLDGKALPMLSGSRPAKMERPVALYQVRTGNVGPDLLLNAFLREL